MDNIGNWFSRVFGRKRRSGKPFHPQPDDFTDPSQVLQLDDVPEPAASLWRNAAGRRFGPRLKLDWWRPGQAPAGSSKESAEASKRVADPDNRDDKPGGSKPTISGADQPSVGAGDDVSVKTEGHQISAGKAEVIADETTDQSTTGGTGDETPDTAGGRSSRFTKTLVRGMAVGSYANVGRQSPGWTPHAAATSSR